MCSGTRKIFFGWFGGMRVYLLLPFCFLQSFYSHSLYDM